MKESQTKFEVKKFFEVEWSASGPTLQDDSRLYQSFRTEHFAIPYWVTERSEKGKRTHCPVIVNRALLV